MVREVKRKNLSRLTRDFISSRYFIPFVLLFIVIISIPIISYLQTGTLDFRHSAAPPKPTAIVRLTPLSGDYALGQPIVAVLTIDGGGQAFGAAQSDISVSENFVVQSIVITPEESGGCNFVFSKRKVPSTSNLSFSGMVADGSKQSCTLYTVTLQPTSNGNGSVLFSRAAVKSYKENRDILLRAEDAHYSVNDVIAPSPTYTPSPTLTPTPTPKSIFN